MSNDSNGSDDDSKKYTVGYKKPPLHSRFRKGKSGNPSGRPKGKVKAVDLDRALDKILRSKIEVNENGRRRKISKLQALLMQSVNKGIKGHHGSSSTIIGHLARRGGAGPGEAEGTEQSAEEFEKELKSLFDNIVNNLKGSGAAGKSEGNSDDEPDETPSPETPDQPTKH